MKKKVEWWEKHSLLILGAGFIIVALAPYLMTRSLPYGFSLDQYHNIGDAIGGLTAPFSSFVGSIMVYFALKAQVKANKLIQDQIHENRLQEIRRYLPFFIVSLESYSPNIQDFTHLIVIRIINKIHNVELLDVELIPIISHKVEFASKGVFLLYPEGIGLLKMYFKGEISEPREFFIYCQVEGYNYKVRIHVYNNEIIVLHREHITN